MKNPLDHKPLVMPSIIPPEPRSRMEQIGEYLLELTLAIGIPTSLVAIGLYWAPVVVEWVKSLFPAWMLP